MAFFIGDRHADAPEIDERRFAHSHAHAERSPRTRIAAASQPVLGKCILAQDCSLNNEAIRRQLGCGPSGRYDMTQQTSRIVKPEPPKKLKFVSIGGIWLVEDANSYRVPTADELKEFIGDVAL